MKKKLIIKLNLLLTLVFFISCEKKSNDDILQKEDTLNIENTVKIEDYYKDAKLLYNKSIMFNYEHPNYNVAELDTNKINEIYNYLKAVYELDCPEKDTIFNIYKIHIYSPCDILHKVQIEGNSALSEIEKLSNSIFPTGNTDLDNILEKYELDSVVSKYSISDKTIIILYSKNTYNTEAIAEELKTISVINSAMGNITCYGDGNNISLIEDTDKVKLIFSNGYGDCPSGCIYKTNWEFEIENSIAKFIRRY